MTWPWVAMDGLSSRRFRSPTWNGKRGPSSTEARPPGPSSPWLMTAVGANVVPLGSADLPRSDNREGVALDLDVSILLHDDAGVAGLERDGFTARDRQRLGHVQSLTLVCRGTLVFADGLGAAAVDGNAFIDADG